MLKEDGTGGFTNERNYFVPGDEEQRDLEGITQASDTNRVYLMHERINAIREYEVSNGTTNQSWDLTSLVGDVQNDGTEGIAFIPNSWLTASGFQDGSGNLYTQSVYGAEGLGGIMLVAVQHFLLPTTGYVYAVDLNTNGTWTTVGKYKTASRGDSCDLAFDASIGRLYILHNDSDPHAGTPQTNIIEVTDLKSSTYGADRKFTTLREFEVPSTKNIEGLGITPALNSDNTLGDMWCFLANDDGNGDALRWFRQLPSTISINAGNNQSAPVSTPVPVPPSVLVRDAFNNPLPNFAVTFAVAAGVGSVTGGATTTDPSGIATVGGWTLGPNPGANTLSVSGAGLSGSPLTFSATASPPPQLVVTPGSRDFGSVVTGATAQVCFWVSNGGGSPLSGTATAGAPFAVVSGSSYSLPASGAATVAVSVATASTGTFSGNVLFESDGGTVTNPVTAVAVASSGPAEATVLVATNAAWKHLDNGSNQGVAWREATFNDTPWASGPAPLGYGDPWIATTVSYGPDSSNKYITTYFRHSFSVPDPCAFATLRLRLNRDDGAVVYLNGVEVRRDLMPAGTIDYTTRAAQTVSGSAESAYFETSLSPSVLVAGNNVMAVEVHQIIPGSSDLSFALELIGSSVSLRKGPYLIYPNDSTQMEVLWQTDATPLQYSGVEWGPTMGYGNSSGNLTESGSGADEHQFSHLITGLTPGALCYYRVAVDTQSFTGSFVSAPPADAANVTFYGFGDTRTYPDKMAMVTAAMLRDMQADPGKRHTLALQVGDWVEFGGTETSWQNEFFNRSYTNSTAVMAGAAAMGCRGSHDMAGGATLMPKYWPYNGTNGYYAFDYGPVHVTVIDQYAPYTSGTVQYAWLTNDLASTLKPFRIALFHIPAYSAGGGHANDATAQATLCPLFVQYGVQLALVGHNHYYAHCYTDGVHHVTSGGGGAPLHTPNLGSTALVAAESAYEYVRFDVSNSVMTVTAVRTNDTVIESFNVYERFTLTYTAGPGGTISGTTAQTVDYSANGTAVTAMPNAHYHFVNWSDGVATAMRTDTNLSASLNVQANFAIDQHTLTVDSAHGGAWPGTVTTNWGAALSQWVTNSPVSGGAGTQYVCTAGAVASNAYTQVSPTNVTLTLTNDATLAWEWQTEYRLSTGTNGNGTVTAADGWYATGGSTTLTATAGANWHFNGWTGDTQGDTNALAMTVTMDRPRAISAVFAANMATNDTPHWWLAQYRLPTNDAGALYEDGDGAPAWKEYIAGTDPTNADSVLRIVRVEPSLGPGGFVLWWSSVSGRVYAVECTTNLSSSGFCPLTSGVRASPTVNVWTDSVPADSGERFYRVSVTNGP